MRRYEASSRILVSLYQARHTLDFLPLRGGGGGGVSTPARTWYKLVR